MTPIISRRAALVIGVANKRSLAWASALSLLRYGNFDHVIITYQSDRFLTSIERMVRVENALLQREFHRSMDSHDSMDSTCTAKRISYIECDVSKEEAIQSLFRERVPQLLYDTGSNCDEQLQTMIHSVAYAPADAMKPSAALKDSNDLYSSVPFLCCSKEAFDIAHSISSYSLLNLTRYALPLLSRKSIADTSSEKPSETSSIVTLTYLGSTRAVPNYNIMGPAKASLESLVRYLALDLSPPPHSIRVNAVSAGPIQTLAARGIRDFSTLKRSSDAANLLKRGVSIEEVGQTVTFLADGSKSGGITGQVIFCDGGYNSYAGR